MEASPYDLTTQARAALRLTDDLHAKALAGPVDGEGPEREQRRASFLRVRPAVQAIADRCVARDPDGRQSAIDGLLRIARVDPEAFAAECEALEAGWSAVMAEAEAFMVALRDPPARQTCPARPPRDPRPPPECTAICEDPLVAVLIREAVSPVPDCMAPPLSFLEDAVARLVATQERDSDTLDFEPDDEPATIEHAPA